MRNRCASRRPASSAGPPLNPARLCIPWPGRRSRRTRSAVFLEESTAITRHLGKCFPKVAVFRQRRLLALTDRPQFRHRLAPPLNDDHLALLGIAHQLGGPNPQIANGSLPHVLHCSTSGLAPAIPHDACARCATSCTGTASAVPASSTARSIRSSNSCCSARNSSPFTVLTYATTSTSSE